MRILIIAFLLSFFIFAPIHADITSGFLEWQAPTEYTNGQALSYDFIANWGVQCTNIDEFFLTKAETRCDSFVKSNVLSTDCLDQARIPFPVTGAYECQVRAFDVDGNGGLWSNTVTVNFTEPPLVPAAPTNLM